jgi:hypothetical protein
MGIWKTKKLNLANEGLETLTSAELTEVSGGKHPGHHHGPEHKHGRDGGRGRGGRKGHDGGRGRGGRGGRGGGRGHHRHH